jgi:hypothetical protein
MKPAIPSPLPTSDDVTTESACLPELDPTFEVQAAELAVCIDERHPVMAGRVRCRFERSWGGIEHWLPCLATVRPRNGDRVMVMRVDGLPLGVVAGVVEGFRERVAPDPRAAHVRRVRPDEVVRIEADDGTPLVEVAAGEHGPVIRLMKDDLEIETPGALKLTAGSIELRARQGEVRVAATDDVVVTGEQIHLN